MDVSSVTAQVIAAAVAVSSIGVAVLGLVTILRTLRLLRGMVASRERGQAVMVAGYRAHADSMRQARLPAWLRGRT